MGRVLMLVLWALAAGACRQPQPDKPDKPVEPQARHGALREAVQRPLDRARAAEAATQEAERNRREALEDAEGG